MDKEYLVRLIYEYNPQLRGEEIVVPEFKRELYKDIERWIGKRQIIAIVGLRRTGKTTLMRQTMKNLENSAFFSFDEEETQKKDVLVYVIDYFISNLSAKHIFLDEIHYVPDWEGVLKRYYDTKGIKFIISGSESLEITKAKESLAGRIIVLKLDTLSFSEFLAMRNTGVNVTKIEKFDFDRIKEMYYSLLPMKERIEEDFSEYIFKGAFPEIVNEEDEEIIQKYIEELVVRKIIYRDIPRIFDIRMRNILHDIFLYICENTSGIFNIRSLADALNISYDTAQNYIFYLHSSFLIKLSQNYSNSPAKRMRKNKKVYVVHPSLAIAALRYKKEELRERIMGQFAESLFAGDYFWRDKNKNEVDVIIPSKPPIPVEIKYQRFISKDDVKPVMKFMERFDSQYGIVITKNTLKSEEIKGKTVYFIPAWVWSLVVS